MKLFALLSGIAAAVAGLIALFKRSPEREHLPVTETRLAELNAKMDGLPMESDGYYWIEWQSPRVHKWPRKHARHKKRRHKRRPYRLCGKPKR